MIACFPQQFGELFEPYENHCIFEFQNLQALDDAMNNTEFNAYIKVIIAIAICISIYITNNYYNIDLIPCPLTIAYVRVVAAILMVIIV